MSIGNSYIAQAHKLVPDVMGILVAFLGIGFVFYLGKLLNAVPAVELADYIQLLILLFIAGTMGVAIWGHQKNAEFSRSSAYLENAIELINRAREVLTAPNKNLTNDRISWVTAARLITRAQHVASLVTVEAHRKIFEAEHDYQRHIFGDFLKDNGAPLPPAFFFGGDFSGLSIGEAVHHPSQGKGGERWIPERIVAVIYRFFQYPEGYQVPLDSSVKLTTSEIRRLWLFGQKGVCDYLTFRRHFVGIGKNVLRVFDGKAKPQTMVAEQIDSEMLNLSGLDE